MWWYSSPSLPTPALQSLPAHTPRVSHIHWCTHAPSRRALARPLAAHMDVHLQAASSLPCTRGTAQPHRQPPTNRHILHLCFGLTWAPSPLLSALKGRWGVSFTDSSSPLGWAGAGQPRKTQNSLHLSLPAWRRCSRPRWGSVEGCLGKAPVSSASWQELGLDHGRETPKAVRPYKQRPLCPGSGDGA